MTRTERDELATSAAHGTPVAEIAAPVLLHTVAALRPASALPARAGVPSTATLQLAEFVHLLEHSALAPGELWRCGQRLASDSLHALMPATLGLNHLWHVLPVALAAMALQQTHTHFELSWQGGRVTFAYRVLDLSIWPRARDAELTLGFIDGLVRSAAPRDYQPLDVRFEHAPDGHAPALAAALGLGCQYRAPMSSYSFARGLLVPARRDAAQAALAAARLAALHARRRERERARALPVRVREAIVTSLGHAEPPTESAVAARCGMSPRTLRRKLAHAGHSFRDELAAARAEYAYAALVHTDLPLRVVAARAGYSQPSALSRAMRTEFGASPRALRSRAVTARASRAAAWPD